MEKPLNTGCLSFFTPNHARHDEQWLQKGSQLTLVCFACFVEIIENKNEPSIRKTKTLQELLKLISSGDILKLLAENETVLSHLFNCLWELTDFDESSKTQNMTVIEIVYQLCCALKSEDLVEKVVDHLSQKLLAAENIKKVSPQLDLFGKLLQKLPALTGKIISRRMNLVAYVSKSTSFPDEAIRSSLFFILTHLYRDKECCLAMPDDITEFVFRECCEVLTSATSKELQINTIALLQNLTRPENLARISKTITSNIERVITCLKKAFLSRIDLVQSLAIGCLSNMVLFDEQIINSDLTGFLFEVFQTKSESLLALGFHCVSQLVNKKALYIKGHISYGFEAILLALVTAVGSRNSKLLKQGFNVLGKILGNCPTELSLISSNNVHVKCLDVISSGLSSLDDGVVLQGCYCFGLFLERRHFGCDVPYSRLTVLVESLMGRLGKVCQSTGHWNRVENKDLKTSMIAAIMEVIKKSLELAMYGKNEPPTLESLLACTEDNTKKELDQFMNKLLELCDQICIPCVIANLRKLHGTTIPERFFNILTRLLSICPAESEEMAKKFVSSCFIRIALDTKAQNYAKSYSTGLQNSVNEFLEIMCCCLLTADMKEDAKYLFRSSVAKVNGTAQELLQVLKQNNSEDEALKNTQECTLVLFYLAYKNGDRLVPRAQLLHALSTFLVLNPKCYDQSVIIQSCLTYLFITDLYRGNNCADDSPLYRNAQQILADGISKYVNNLDAVYFHEFALVEWAMEVQELNPELRREIVELWFSHTGENDIDARETELWRGIVDRYPRALLLLASILGTGEAHTQNAILQVLHNILSTCNAESEVLTATLKELKLSLQKLFLNQAMEPLMDRNIESILKLMCLLVTSAPRTPLDDDVMKLVYHVVNLLLRPGNSATLCTECLNFLNASIIQDTKSGSDQVLAFLLKHHDYNKFLGTIINSSDNAMNVESFQQTSTLAAVLISVSNLTRIQKKFGTVTENILEVRTEVVLSLLCYVSSPLLQFAANTFWESILRADEIHTTISLRTENGVPSEANLPQQKLSKVHLKMILVRLQNSILQVNPLVQLSALRCLEALFSLEENARYLLQDPWNKAMLREVKDFSSSDSLIICLRLHSLFLYHKRTKGLALDFAVTELVQVALEKFFEREAAPESRHEKWLSTCAKFFREVIQCKPDAMTTMERSNLKCHVEHLVESCHGNNNHLRHNDVDFVYIQGLLIHSEVLHGKRDDSLQTLQKLSDYLK